MSSSSTVSPFETDHVSFATLPTVTFAKSVDVCIRLIEMMTTMTAPFASAFGGQTFPCQEIHAHGDYPKMGRITARSLSTEMVNHETVWNWADQPFVGDPMDQLAYSGLLVPLETAIALMKPGTSPKPTTSSATSFVDKTPETRGFLASHRNDYTLVIAEMQPCRL